jgi:catechol 2,3-dioxygenase-like lactoylglutathione lyase family enzyme
MKSICILEIKVSDMEEARRFYCDQLGLRVKNENYLPTVLVLEHDGPDLILHTASKPAEISYPDTSMSMLIFQVDDIEALAADFKAKGITIEEGPRPSPPGAFMAFRDPFGNVHAAVELNSD